MPIWNYATIGIKPTSGTLSLIVRRLFNVLLYISQKDGDIETYRRPLIEIMAHIEYNSNDAKLLKDHFRSMMNGILVEWNSVDAKGTQTWEASPLLAHARIESSQNRPTKCSAETDLISVQAKRISNSEP